MKVVVVCVVVAVLMLAFASPAFAERYVLPAAEASGVGALYDTDSNAGELTIRDVIEITVDEVSGVDPQPFYPPDPI